MSEGLKRESLESEEHNSDCIKNLSFTGGSALARLVAFSKKTTFAYATHLGGG